MQIELPEHFVEKLRARSGGLPDDTLAAVALLMLEMGSETFEFSNEDKQSPPLVDGLTGCRTREQLKRDLLEELWTPGRRFEARFLCLNILQFKKYVDVHGMAESDLVLKELAEQLMLGHGHVYRTGGDRFLVWLMGDVIPSPPMHDEISFRQSVLDVSLLNGRHLYYHFLDGVLWHIENAMLFGSTDSPRVFRYESEGE